jgi:hypothetical protein
MDYIKHHTKVFFIFLLIVYPTIFLIFIHWLLSGLIILIDKWCGYATSVISKSLEDGKKWSKQ